MSSLNIDFLDSESGLKNVSGDEGLYIEILYTFLVDYKELDSTLDNMFHIDEKDDLLTEIHTLKGLAATIGATDLHNHTKLFESKLKQDLYDNDSFTLVLDSLRELISSLNTYFDKNPFVNE